MHHTQTSRGLLVAAALLLGGCAAGPAYVRPAAPIATSYGALALPTQTDSAVGEFGATQRFAEAPSVGEHWWQAFGSPALDSLVAQALRASPTISSAEATLRQAEALFAAQSGSTRVPVVDGSLTAQRQKFNPAVLGQNAEPREFSLFNATVSVRYRLDLAGANRRALEALAARADFRRQQLQGAQLSLAAAITGTAFQQAKLAAHLAVIESLVRLEQEQLSIVRDQLRLGAATPDELRALERQHETTRATLPAQRQLVLQNQHLLATLTGRVPGDLSVPSFTLDKLSLTTDLPMVIPSELVRRRPDILAAEALMQAANAEYGVAVAKRYPQLTLSANLGSQALTAGSLFGGETAIWSVVSQLTQPLFNRGLSAEKRAALAAFDASAANYQAVILDALREMADVLTALDADAQSLAALASAHAASEDLLASERRRYALGAASYLQVLTVQLQSERVRVPLITAQTQRFLDTIALFQAIGGTELLTAP